MISDQVLSLEKAKDILITYINPYLNLGEFRYTNKSDTLLSFELDVIYLHTQIIFNTPEYIDEFLRAYCNLRGLYNTQMYLNYALIDFQNTRIMNAIHCATLWNTDPEMIRVLYKWGGIINAPNIDSTLITESTLPYYTNYFPTFDGFNKKNNVNYGRRNLHEFVYVLNEIDYITKKRKPPSNWTMPTRNKD